MMRNTNSGQRLVSVSKYYQGTVRIHAECLFHTQHGLLISILATQELIIV